jgi:hypothetical protein
MMKLFFGVENSASTSKLGPDVAIEGNSSVASCVIDSGFIKGSVLNNVRCKHIEADGAILINVTAERIVAKPGSIVYNVATTEPTALLLDDGDVRAGVFQGDGTQIVIASSISIDGGEGNIFAVKYSMRAYKIIWCVHFIEYRKSLGEQGSVESLQL